MGPGPWGRGPPTDRRAHAPFSALAGTNAASSSRKRSHAQMDDADGNEPTNGFAVQADEEHAKKVLRRMYEQQRGDFTLSVRLDAASPATTFECSSALLSGWAETADTRHEVIIRCSGKPGRIFFAGVK